MIQPTSVGWTFTAGAAASLQYQPALVTVKDSNGIPLKGVNVILSLGLSPGTSTTPAMAICLSDATTGQCVQPITTPTDVVTSDTGTIDLWIGMSVGGTTSYTGLLYAYSGSLMATAPLSVTCKSSSATGGPQCS
ncbi:MAG: hypothetical protein M0Z84_10355 [Gammaproteobacteria bacterium]|nr:hypothetical protein [Gammaproteobacteria bacterium]